MAVGTNMEFEGNVKPSSIEQAGFEPDLWASRFTEIPSNMQMRVDWTSGNADYVGYAPRGLSSSTNGWLLQKYTYDGSNRCTLRQIAYDAWDNRATTAIFA